MSEKYHYFNKLSTILAFYPLLDRTRNRIITITIAAMIPYSFSFCFSISHFSFWASERNSYDITILLSSPTSAVSARASVLSTMMSNFSPRSMILSTYHTSLLLLTNVVNHNSLDSIELLLHAGSSISIRIVPLGLYYNLLK